MNILLMNWRDPKNPRSGGAEVVTMIYAKALQGKGHSVTWLALKFPGSPQSEKVDGVEVIRVGNVLTQFFLFPLYYLRNKKKFSLVIEEVHGLPYLTPLYVKGNKLVFIHEVAGDIWNSMYHFPFNTIGLLAEKCFFALYKKMPFLTVSQSTENDLRTFGIKNITVITNGISLSPAPVAKEKNPTFIFLSRLVKMKGIEDILLAFVSIKKQLPESQLWIVGSGDDEYVKKLKEKIESYHLRDVTFFGRVSDAKRDELLQRAHLLLHASVKEGWGLVVLEAAAYHTPSIVYDVPGLREVVIDGKTGILIKSRDPEKMGREAVRLYKNKHDYHTMQNEAYQWAKQHTWENSTKAFLQLMESL